MWIDDLNMEAIVQAAAGGDSSAPAFCPKCKQRLVPQLLGQSGVFVLRCPSQHGTWMSPSAAQKILQYAKHNPLVLPKSNPKPKGLPKDLVFMVAVILAIVVLRALGPQIQSKDGGYAERQRVAVSATHWPARDYKQWHVLPTRPEDVPVEEFVFFARWCVAMQPGLDNRLNIEEGLNSWQKDKDYEAMLSEYVRRQEHVLQVLSTLIPPPRLEPFAQGVISAGHDQIRFYQTFAAAKYKNKRVKTKDLLADLSLKACHQKLLRAYHDFQVLYPARSQAFNNAIEKRLCWFDII